jgi:hypothetical protein
LASLRRTGYDEPDPTIDPDERRKDTRVDLILVNNIPLTNAFTLVVSAIYTKSYSSLPNFEFDNKGASIGVGWRF